MPIQYLCPNCQATCVLAAQPQAGEAVFCNACNHCFEIPSSNTNLVQATPVAAPPPATPVPTRPNVGNPSSPESRATNTSPSNQAQSVVHPSQNPTRPPNNMAASEFDPFSEPSSGVVQSSTQTSKLKSKRIGWPVISIMGSMVFGLLCIVFFFVFDGAGILSGLNPFSGSATSIAHNYQSHVTSLEDLLNRLDTGEKKEWVVKELEQLAEIAEQNGRLAAQLKPLSESECESIEKIAGDVSTKLSQMRGRLQSVQDKYRRFDPISIAVRRISSASEATGSQLTGGILTLQTTDTRQETHRQKIELDREVVGILAAATKNEIDSVVKQLQAKSDEINRLAESQSQNKNRPGLPPRSFEEAERAALKTRMWLASLIERESQPGADFRMTLRDIQNMNGRFIRSRLGAPLEPLSTSSQTRVAILNNGAPASTPPPNFATNSRPPSNLRQQPLGSKPPIRQQTTPPPNPKLGSIQNSRPADRVDPGPDNPFGSPTQNSSTQNPPPTSSPFNAPSNNDENPFGSNQTPSPTALKTLDGPNIVIVHGSGPLKSREVDGIRRKLATRLRCSRSSSDAAGDKFAISLEYSGKLSDVVNLIDFGTVDLTDAQSRTIYVTAK